MVAIVHNGIIENFTELKSNLQLEGFTFESDTDTEVIANLLQKNYDSSPEDAMIRTIGMLKGHYSFVAMFADGTLAAARYHHQYLQSAVHDILLQPTYRLQTWRQNYNDL